MTEYEYKCARCGQVYKKGWSDAEAKSELENNFPGISTEECDIVCDDCYNKITRLLPIEDFNKLWWDEAHKK